MPRRFLIPAFCLLLSAGGARGQEPTAISDWLPRVENENPAGTDFDLPPSVMKALEALGASSGVPDGVGFFGEPKRPVSGQHAQLSLVHAQIGATAPLRIGPDRGVFVTGTVRNLFTRGGAILPESQTPFPNNLWDIQTGAAYIHEFARGQTWGVCLSGGSASDRPFNSIHEMVISGLAFFRTQEKDDHAWLFYVVSTTNGQIGQNIPIPGVAYEFHGEKFDGIAGFPFVSLAYRFTDRAEFDFNYAALTDIRARMSYRVFDQVRPFGGFSWVSQSWFRADRPDNRLQLFYYEKRLEGGVAWIAHDHVNLSLTAGYAFDRYFLEARSFTLTGRNHLGIAPAPFMALQMEIRY